MSTPPPGPSADSPLAARLKRDAAASREALAAFGLAPDSYDALLDRASQCQTALRDAGFRHAAARLARAADAFASALDAPQTDLTARGRAYLALLESILLQSLTIEAAGPKWLTRLDRECAALDQGSTDASLALLTAAGLCRDAGATVTPPPTGPIPVTWQRWRFSLVAAHAPDAASIPARIAAAVAHLKAAKTPGFVVIDLAEPVCPEQRPLRASHPDAGAGELRARIDSLLQTARADILNSADRDHALGVIGAAFLALHLVTANQVAFITAYRMMPLLDPGDPREHKLGAFRSAFGDL